MAQCNTDGKTEWFREQYFWCEDFIAQINSRVIYFESLLLLCPDFLLKICAALGKSKARNREENAASTSDKSGTSNTKPLLLPFEMVC